MITVNNLSYSYPQKDLFHDISFTLEDGQHCALIGASGNGKSTLVDILMDPERYLFDGAIEITPNCRMGYVSQFSKLDTAKEITVFEYIAEEFIKLQSDIDTICAEMASSSDLDPLLEKYQTAFDTFQAIGGDDYERLIKLKLNQADLLKHEGLLISKLSGGEFKLIQVIKEMLTAPDLLIMDEPDVFLDFENLNSLKNLINSHKGSLLVITHNRYLLNHCFHKILHLENKELQEFDGRYIDYNFSLLQSKIELQELAAIDTEEIERNEIIINKLRNVASYHTEASRGKSLKARISLQERLEARRIKAPFVEMKEPVINLMTDQELKETLVLKVSDYSLAFENILLEKTNFEIESGDKVALIGPNGSGKTTLLREIFTNDHKAIKINEATQMAYLSQLQGEVLNEANTIYEEFFDLGLKTYQEINSYLLDYGFEEEIMTQTIGSLSGGEKNLLQLAKIALSKANLLLLDEPTSHLDTYSQLALEKALQNYNGAVLMISHDFYTIVNCMDYVLMIEDQTIRKVSMRKFRKVIYASHFDKDYLELEQKKKDVETKITLALKDNNFLLAKDLSEELEAIIKLM